MSEYNIKELAKAAKEMADREEISLDVLAGIYPFWIEALYEEMSKIN